MTKRTINASWVLAQDAALANQSIVIDGGKIASMGQGKHRRWHAGSAGAGQCP